MSPQFYGFTSALPPFCPDCNALLRAEVATTAVIARGECPKCGEVYGRHSSAWLPADEDTTLLFDHAVERLKIEGYKFDEASNLLREYYSRFTNARYCADNRVPMQDDDSFHHDGPIGIAMRAHFCVRLGLSPDYASFIKWASKVQGLAKWPTATDAP